MYAPPSSLQHCLQLTRQGGSLSIHTIDEWIKKMWYLNTVENQSAIKKNEVLACVTTWMESEDTILSKVSLIEILRDLTHK